MNTIRTIVASLCVAAVALGSGAAQAGGGRDGGHGDHGGHDDHGGHGGHDGGHGGHGPIIVGHHNHGGVAFVAAPLFFAPDCWYERATVWDPLFNGYVVRTVRVCD